MTSINSWGSDDPAEQEKGGTGRSSSLPWGVICGSTTTTGPLQSVNPIGDVGQVLASNGTDKLPSFQPSQIISHPFGTTQNIGFTLSGTTITVHSADGSALSGSNIGYVTLASRTAGNLVKIAVTANQDVTAANMQNMKFGISDANWALDMPLYIYAVLNDAEDAIGFGISRIPHISNSPPDSEMGRPSTKITGEQWSIFMFDDVTLEDYDDNPCCAIGSFKATAAWDAVNIDWTFTAFDFQDGVGQWNEGIQFLLPTGQRGAASGSHFKLNAGTTAPVFDTDTVGYFIYRSGLYDCITYFLTCTTAGVGAVGALATIPFDGYGSAPGLFTDDSASTRHVLYSLVFAGGGSRTVEYYKEGEADIIELDDIDLSDSIQARNQFVIKKQ